MPRWIGKLSKLEVLTLGHPNITNLSPELGALPYLKTLQLFNCCALERISQIPSTVTKLHIGRCPLLTTLDIAYLKNLSELYVFGSSDLSERALSEDLLEWKISKDYGYNLAETFVKMMGEQHRLEELASFCLRCLKRTSYSDSRGLFTLRAKRQMRMPIQNDLTRII